MESFYWHDYETFGADPRRYHPAQFAGQRTDLELNVIDEPLVLYCRPVDDDLPQPDACLITGITPQIAQRRGLAEGDFAACLQQQLAQPNTCGVGYNSIRFDDEITRHLLYRNLFDPYAREWQHGNSRWDLIDVVRLCYALRPQGIEWPARSDGEPSFKLEDLARSNGLLRGPAHDAMADVQATIGLARLLRQRQPRLFDHCLRLRGKHAARALLDFVNLRPVLHASGKYPSSRGGLAMVVPLCPHPINRNGIVVYDLSCQPDPLLQLSAVDIRQRVFTSRSELPDELERIPLKTIHLNRAPVISPVGVLAGVDLERIKLDPSLCERHRQQILQQQRGLAEKVREVFAEKPPTSAPRDPDQALYDGLFEAADQRLLPQLRAAEPAQFDQLSSGLRDPRLVELAFRYQARNHPEALDAQGRQRWHQHRRKKLLAEHDGLPVLAAYRQQLDELRTQTPESDRRAILDELAGWATQLASDL